MRSSICFRSSVTSTVLALLIAGAAVARGPNVIIFYADDMGIGDVGCYGCKDIRTPNIDRLAADGVRFTNYYSACSLCSPSRAALMTGRYPYRAGVPTNAPSTPGEAGMPGSEVTIAELAKSRGYATGLFGKWHLGFSDGTKPNDQGFDEFFGFHSGCIDYYSHMFYWQEPHHHDLYHNRQEIHEEGQYMTDLITREATRFVEQHRAVPFLMYVAFNAPHYPMQAPKRLLDQYAQLPTMRRDYAALVAGLDEAIGKIMERLRQQGLAEQTLVLFASDNGAGIEWRANGGGGSNAPYRGHKSSLFEGGIHMPAVISWPGHLPKAETRNAVAMSIDVLPTVAEAIGATLPSDRVVDGRSWMPPFKDPATTGHERLFWKLGNQEAVREGRWKLIRNALLTAEGDKKSVATGEDAVFLADLQADPGETRNLRRAHPEIVERLDAALRTWVADVSKNK